MDGHEAGVMKLVDRVVQELAGVAVEFPMGAIQGSVRAESHPDIIAEREEERAPEPEAFRQASQDILDPAGIVEHRPGEELEAFPACGDAPRTKIIGLHEIEDERLGRIFSHIIIEVPGMG